LSPTHQRKTAVRALPELIFIADAAAKVAPGTVDAPIGVIAGAAILVSAASLAVFTLGLKPGNSYIPILHTYSISCYTVTSKVINIVWHCSGTDAAAKMQERDDKSGRWRK